MIFPDSWWYLMLRIVDDGWWYLMIAENRRKFRSQTSDSMDRWKAEMGRVREEKRREEERISKRESLRGKKIQVREKVGKSRNTVFFQWFVAPEGWKVGSLKRRVRSQLAGWEMKNCTLLWREAHLEVKQAKNTSRPDHFWKLRCRKSARRCGAKHIWKSKCAKHLSVGPLLEVEMSKKCRPLWRNWKSKCTKHTMLGPLLAVEMLKKVHAVVARSTFRSQKCKGLTGSEHFWRFRCRFAWQAHGIMHLAKSKQNMRPL